MTDRLPAIRSAFGPRAVAVERPIDRPVVEAQRLGTTAAGLLRAVHQDRVVAIVFPDAADVPPSVVLRPLDPPHLVPISLAARPGTPIETLGAYAAEIRGRARTSPSTAAPRT